MKLMEELEYRFGIKDKTDGVSEALETGKLTFYIGCDGTSDSLAIGNLSGWCL